MLDRDLAKLYGVETENVTRQVRRNFDRFPADFMFQLTRAEFNNLIRHFGGSKRGGTRKLPLVFTEQGVAMLSSVLNSQRAIQVNIQIMRTFTKLRELLITNEQLRRKIEAMERKYDQHFRVVFEAIKRLIQQDDVKPRKGIGF